MVSEAELSRALATRVAELNPDVERELERVLARATRRAWTWRTAGAAGLVAAVTLTAILLGRDWRTTGAPQPVDQVPVRAQELVPGRGMYMSPAPLNPARYVLHFVERSFGTTPDILIDVPEGWSQDDKFALATAPAPAPTARRIDPYAFLNRVQVDGCRSGLVRPGNGTDDLAIALSSIKGVTATAPTPVTLDGYSGHFVHLQLPTSQAAFDSCSSEYFRLYPMHDGSKAYDKPGWSELLWILDVEGQRLVICASYGPDVGQAEVDELYQMVQSITFIDP